MIVVDLGHVYCNHQMLGADRDFFVLWHCPPSLSHLFPYSTLEMAFLLCIYLTQETIPIGPAQSGLAKCQKKTL